MKSSQVLKELRSLREAWRKQSFSYSREQQERYDHLVKLRRERVSSLYAEGRVSKSSPK